MKIVLYPQTICVAGFGVGVQHLWLTHGKDGVERYEVSLLLNLKRRRGIPPTIILARQPQSSSSTEAD